MRDEQPPDPWISQPVRPPYHSYHPSTVPQEEVPAFPRTKTAGQPATLEGDGWWDRLPFMPKIAAITAGLLVVFWGGFAVVGLFTGAPTSRADAPADGVVSYSEQASEQASEPAEMSPAPTTGLVIPTMGPATPFTGPATPTIGPAPTTMGPATTASTTGTDGTLRREPVIETRIVTETRTVDYDSETVRDNSLPKGTSEVRTTGVPGVRTLTYKVTLTDGVQTAKELVRSVVTTDPVTEVVAIGTMPNSKCDPNYSGCVPIASDVDCAGDGDGPEYVEGPVNVIGDDIYDLDPDGDGVACD